VGAGEDQDDQHCLALLVLLKCYQRLGYFPRPEQIPAEIAEHVWGGRLLTRSLTTTRRVARNGIGRCLQFRYFQSRRTIRRLPPRRSGYTSWFLVAKMRGTCLKIVGRKPEDERTNELNTLRSLRSLQTKRWIWSQLAGRLRDLQTRIMPEPLETLWGSRSRPLVLTWSFRRLVRIR
jgi:hypothetical protein